MAERWWLDVDDDRFWSSLLKIGILFLVMVSFTSDLGLDTHVRLAVDDDSLVWGHTRPIDSLSSDPNYAPEISQVNLQSVAWVLGGEFAVKLASLTFTLLLIGLTYTAVAMVRNSEEDSRRCGIRAAALVAIYPTFIFSTGRAYSESILAVLLLLGLVVHLWSRAEESRKMRLLAVVISTSMLAAIFAIKGYSILNAVPIGMAILLWFVLDWKIPAFHKLSRKPLNAGMATSLIVGWTMLILGASGNGGTLSVIADNPPRFFTALIISFFDVIVVYMLFGMVLWPFVHCTLSRLREIEDKMATILTVVVSGFCTAIIIYVAALWTYESMLWDAQWPWMMWTMGNNGRYISIIMIPTLLLLTRIKALDGSMPFFDLPAKRTKAVLLGVMLILPISLLTAAHGQTMWTDEAAEVLDNNLADEEDFLFVSPATLGMHYLYTFHTGIEDVNERDITGHWRADTTDWTDELVNGTPYPNRGDLSDVEWIVLAPDVEWAGADGWSLAGSGTADFMNGGGEWQIWTSHGRVVAF